MHSIKPRRCSRRNSARCSSGTLVFGQLLLAPKKGDGMAFGAIPVRKGTLSSVDDRCYDDRMVLHHVAAILIFSGPLFWIGLWMAVDPAGITELAGFLVRMAGRLVRPPLKPDVDAALNSLRLRKRLRFAGLALVLAAMIV